MKASDQLVKQSLFTLTLTSMNVNVCDWFHTDSNLNFCLICNFQFNISGLSKRSILQQVILSVSRPDRHSGWWNIEIWPKPQILPDSRFMNNELSQKTVLANSLSPTEQHVPLYLLKVAILNPLGERKRWVPMGGIREGAFNVCIGKLRHKLSAGLQGSIRRFVGRLLLVDIKDYKGFMLHTSATPCTKRRRS